MRVVADLNKQIELGSISTDQITIPSNPSPQPSSKTFKIKRNYYLSTSILLNDIQNFADLYRLFRDTHSQYFDLQDEVGQGHAEITAHDQQSSDASSNNNMNDAGSPEMVVPVDPDLCRAFSNLQLIDQYRLSGDALLLDNLIQNAESPLDPNDESSEEFDSQQDCYEGEESGNEEARDVN